MKLFVYSESTGFDLGLVDKKEIKNRVAIQKEKRKMGAEAMEQYLWGGGGSATREKERLWGQRWSAAAVVIHARRSDGRGSGGVRRWQWCTRGGGRRRRGDVLGLRCETKCGGPYYIAIMQYMNYCHRHLNCI